MKSKISPLLKKVKIRGSSIGDLYLQAINRKNNNKISLVLPSSRKNNNSKKYKERYSLLLGISFHSNCLKILHISHKQCNDSYLSLKKASWERAQKVPRVLGQLSFTVFADLCIFK